jgi:hypothetical protein
MPYQVIVRHPRGYATGLGCLLAAEWRVVFFPSAVDPRDDPDLWREGETSGDSVAIETTAIDFRFGHEGPSSLKPGGVNDDMLAASSLPKDHFGTIATTSVEFPPGTYTLRVTSDDGVRVLVDGKVVVEDWTRHAPRESTAELVFSETRTVEIRVEHFELDGLATLSLRIDAELDPARRFVPR